MHRLAWALLLALLAGPARGQEPWIALESPASDAVHEGVAWVEVRGRAGVGPTRHHDVVLVLDLSASTWLASGVDVDGDGELGRMSSRLRQLRSRNIQTTNLERRHYSSDLDDTTAAALIEAARRFAAGVDPRYTRIALIDADERARVAAPLGASSEQLSEALATLAARARTTGGKTDFAAPIRAALALLGPPHADPPRHRTVLLLSDGHPSSPHPPSLARREALAAAREAAASEVRILAFALGPDALAGLSFYRRLAEAAGGRTLQSETPGAVLGLLPRVRLAGVSQVTLENRTSGAAGSAVRLFADGSFDGFLPLVAGANEIAVRVEGEAGGSAELRRRVHLLAADSDPALAARRAAELEALLELLRARTAETELMLELETGRSRDGNRELELELEPVREQ
ncbi:MAG: vWA domain-containing protein [Myxococcota bacterium]|nr:vWA domain-containing protein [Myxococcota bacterium]